ncbi:hypothetical protein SISSUDRAFT_1046028 [Sistotremastrum suecicum HHB10207 ss-3]|uniref:Macrofage activating glyco protein n=1 Tax=Sistotremastrum suecicum HHB10207 ss-3 TaxID=1314776 RepID=A0A166E1G5_9AGAM|nr:hypothetical protein SISSUDRAFT_1046028 [Sistotremastrum suecicum HHB10207 ss-3]
MQNTRSFNLPFVSQPFLVLAAFAISVLAQSTTITPLVDQKFTYTDLPQQVDPVATGRGPQSGYNICNSGTEGPDSLCQTAFVNNLADWCVWGPPTPDSTIADTESETVAWCSQPGHGTRVIPPGALTGVQFLRAPAYIQITGHIDQTKIDMQAGDSGGEMDPHGADLRGNPLGGLLFSNGFPASNGDNSTYTQVIQWTNFMGGGVFCFKACDPTGSDAANYCQHSFDRIGCSYNAPAAYEDGVFLSCDSDNQDFPGVYTDASGNVQTYTQPGTSAGVISTLPYEPKIPATSNCVTYQSTDLYQASQVTTATSSTQSTTQEASPTSSANSDAVSPRAALSISSTASPTASVHTSGGDILAAISWQYMFLCIIISAFF